MIMRVEIYFLYTLISDPHNTFVMIMIILFVVNRVCDTYVNNDRRQLQFLDYNISYSIDRIHRVDAPAIMRSDKHNIGHYDDDKQTGDIFIFCKDR